MHAPILSRGGRRAPLRRPPVSGRQGHGPSRFSVRGELVGEIDDRSAAHDLSAPIVNREIQRIRPDLFGKERPAGPRNHAARSVRMLQRIANALRLNVGKRPNELDMHARRIKRTPAVLHQSLERTLATSGSFMIAIIHVFALCYRLQIEHINHRDSHHCNLLGSTRVRQKGAAQCLNRSGMPYRVVEALRYLTEWLIAQSIRVGTSTTPRLCFRYQYPHATIWESLYGR